MTSSATILVATLGGQPQIITFLLDLLLERGAPIDQVVLIYLSGNPRYHSAYDRLRREFQSGSYPNSARRISLEAVEVRAGGQALRDAVEPAEVEAIRQTFHSLLAERKARGCTLHLGLSGGRRIMALAAIAAAMQYLTPADRVWHLYTPDDVAEQARGGALLHAPREAGLQLIAVPFVPWAAYFPGLAPLLERPAQEVNATRGWLDEADRRRCQAVWNALTLRQRQVLRLLAQGLNRRQAAQHLTVQPSTIDSHRENILACCTRIWEQEGLLFQPHSLLDKFRPFLSSLEPV